MAGPAVAFRSRCLARPLQERPLVGFGPVRSSETGDTALRAARRLGSEQLEHLVVLREPSGLLLRENRPAVDDDVELPRLAGLDRRRVLRLLVDLGRETRSPPVVAASDGAVLDQHVAHGASLASGAAAARAMLSR